MTPQEPDYYQRDDKDRTKTVKQLIWGIALVLAGLGVFFRIPQVMPKIETIEWFSSSLIFIRFCFYFLGILLIAGGSKKIYYYYRKLKTRE